MDGVCYNKRMDTKKCSHCKEVMGLASFCSHPTCKFGKSNVCRECKKADSTYRYLNEKHKEGIKDQKLTGATVKESTAKRGDERGDGMVFASKRKTVKGYREWWVTKDHLKEMNDKGKARHEERMETDEGYRNRQKAGYRSESKKAAKRKWNKSNRAYLDDWQANRRASLVSDQEELTVNGKKEVRDFYKFRDVLNKAQGGAVFHVDHIHPISRGGKHHPSNLSVTTAKFNTEKGCSVA